VQAYVPGSGVAERLGHGGERLEAERVPQADRQSVRFHDCVELDRARAITPRLLEDPLAGRARRSLCERAG
jgi:hypothetical protein